MFELTPERRNTLKSFLINAGTVVFGMLIIGSIIRPEGIHLHLFKVGCTMYLVAIALAWLVDFETKEGDE